MADNVSITAGSGTTVATDEVSSRHFQLIKLAYGADGSATLVDTGSALPVTGTVTLGGVPTVEVVSHLNEEAVLLTSGTGTRTSNAVVTPEHRAALFALNVTATGAGSTVALSVTAQDPIATSTYHTYAAFTAEAGTATAGFLFLLDPSTTDQTSAATAGGQRLVRALPYTWKATVTVTGTTPTYTLGAHLLR